MKYYTKGHLNAIYEEQNQSNPHILQREVVRGSWEIHKVFHDSRKKLLPNPQEICSGQMDFYKN